MGGERRLVEGQSWLSDDPENLRLDKNPSFTSSVSSMDEYDHQMMTSATNGGREGGKWDQFEQNKRLFGVEVFVNI